MKLFKNLILNKTIHNVKKSRALKQWKKIDFRCSIRFWDQIRGSVVWEHCTIIDDFIWKVKIDPEITVKKVVFNLKLNYNGIKKPFIEWKYDFGFWVYDEKYE